MSVLRRLFNAEIIKRVVEPPMPRPAPRGKPASSDIQNIEHPTPPGAMSARYPSLAYRPNWLTKQDYEEAEARIWPGCESIVMSFHKAYMGKGAVICDTGAMLSFNPLYHQTTFPMSKAPSVPWAIGLRHYEDHGYYHFVIETLTRLMLALPYVDDKVHLFTSDVPFVSEYLELLGIDPSMVISELGAQAETLLVPTFSPYQWFGDPPPSLLCQLRDRLSPFSGDETKTGLAGFNMRNNRGLSNDSEIVGCLEDAGYAVDVFDFGSMSVQDQIATARNYDVLVGAHGGGLTNALWMQPGSTLIEVVTPQHPPYNNYWQLCASVGLDYAAVFTGDDNRVNLEELKEVLP